MGLETAEAMALFTAEAEFDALTQAVREAVWIRRMFGELRISGKNPTTVYGGNLLSVM